MSKSQSASQSEMEDPDKWVLLHGEILFHYALARVRDNHLAKDLVQDTFLAAWKQRASFAGKSSFRSWLTGILRHKILDYWRTAKRFNLATDLAVNEESEELLFTRLGAWQAEHKQSSWDPSEQSQQRDMIHFLSDCIEDLPEKLRRVFVLCEVEEEDREKTAAMFGVSANHLAVLVYRARQKLRICLEKKISS